jgi:aarF domain-containing kinase
LRCVDRPQVNEHDRAEQLRGVIERLGPAYVKVAQAMSTRVDLLSPEYYMQIQLLQDRVPPFPCDQAKEVSYCERAIAQLLCCP